MLSPELIALEDEIAAAGLGVSPCGRCRLTVRRPGETMTARYAPVWVTCLNDQWYVVAWGAHVYPLDDRHAVIEVCGKVIAALETGECGSADRKLEQMSLRRLDVERYAEFRHELYEAERISPPDVLLNDLCEHFQQIGFDVRTSGDQSVRIATTANDDCNRRVSWCTIYRNHWYVRTPSGRVYGCEDELIVELCFWTLKAADPTIDTFSVSAIEGHSMFEVTGRLKDEIETWAAFEVDQ